MKKNNFKYVFDNFDSVNYLINKRNKYSDLYRSEKKFFSKVLSSRSFLDLGCGVGGLSKILSNKVSKFEYIGLDVSKKMISKARELYPENKFLIYNGKKINLKQKVDTSICLGTLHYLSNYKLLIKQMYLLSKKSILFDVRTTFNNSIVNTRKSYQIINKKKRINYNIINFYEILDFILFFTKKKCEINIYGYYDYPAKNVNSVYSRILMTMFYINKKKKYNLNIKI